MSGQTMLMEVIDLEAATRAGNPLPQITTAHKLCPTAIAGTLKHGAFAISRGSGDDSQSSEPLSG